MLPGREADRIDSGVRAGARVRSDSLAGDAERAEAVAAMPGTSEQDARKPARRGCEKGFGSMSAVRIAGISYRQLDHWASQGLVRPSLAEAAGSGSRRLYSYSDLVTLRAVKRLLDAGLRLSRIRAVIHKLDSEFDTDLASSNLVIDGTTPVLVTSEDELFDLLKNGQGVLNVLPMVSVQQEVDASIVELFPTTAADGRSLGGQQMRATA